MKLYKNLVNAVATTLQEIFKEKRYADKALESLFKKNPQWGSRDRRFVAEGVYDITRNFRLYAHLAESEKNFWFITAVWLADKGIELPDWPEFKHVDATALLSTKKTLERSPAIFQSYPDWLWQLCQKELGEDIWKKEAQALNEQAPVYLRTNTLKCSAEKLSLLLQQGGLETIRVQDHPNALQLVKRENVFRNSFFKEGYFEVQDAGSQQIVEFLDPKAGELVIDACAGAGGKSLYICAMMKNKGKVISLDVEAWKLEELKKRARRAGAFNIEARLIEPGKTIKMWEARAEKVLLDVPCSGLGVLKRNPDAKWKLNETSLEKTKELQRQILSEYSQMVKPGGTLVYSTCSILPSENSEQVQQFLKANTEFSLHQQISLMPSTGTDGFYMARLIRQ